MIQSAYVRIIHITDGDLIVFRIYPTGYISVFGALCQDFRRFFDTITHSNPIIAKVGRVGKKSVRFHKHLIHLYSLKCK